MRIHIDQIPDTGLKVEFTENPEDYAVFRDLSETGECEVVEPLKIRVNLNRLHPRVEVRGQIETKLRLRCSRCLKSFETDLNQGFLLVYDRQGPAISGRRSTGELELTDDDVGLMFYRGDVLDTRQAIQEEVLAAVPLKPLCRSTCMGLCPRCGADLNRRPCGCEKKDTDPRLAVLQTFR